jgi:oligopeptide/dipeptide ABC transporter ATP-binding protein
MDVARSNPVRSSKGQPSRRAENLLEVRDLWVRFGVDAGHEFTVLDKISFDIAPGEIVGLLGESGSGKTTMALSLLRLLPPVAKVAGGAVRFRGRDLLSLNEKQLREVRGAEISLVHQDSSVLNPVMRVGDQITEVVRAHRNWPTRRAREAAEAALAAVGLGGSPRIYTSYPHQLSGGQRQRIVIAQALVCKPALVIADEPTASLDATTAAEVVDLMKRLKNFSDTAFLFISHDPATLAMLADRTMVMYAGQIVEDGPLREVYAQPLHPYTRALLECAPQPPAGAAKRDRAFRLATIPGSPPDPMEKPVGCSFSNRCVDRMETCDTSSPGESHPAPSRAVRCFKHRAGRI